MSAFEIEFECENCGNEWTQEFESGILVKKSTKVGMSGVAAYESSQFGKNNYKRNITCPVCETCDRVSVVERRPLTEQE